MRYKKNDDRKAKKLNFYEHANKISNLTKDTRRQKLKQIRKSLQIVFTMYLLIFVICLMSWNDEKKVYKILLKSKHILR